MRESVLFICEGHTILLNWVEIVPDWLPDIQHCRGTHPWPPEDFAEIARGATTLADLDDALGTVAKRSAAWMAVCEINDGRCIDRGQAAYTSKGADIRSCGNILEVASAHSDP